MILNFRKSLCVELTHGKLVHIVPFHDFGRVKSEAIFNLTIHIPLGLLEKILTSQQEGRFNYFGYQREFHIVAFYIMGFCTASKQSAGTKLFRAITIPSMNEISKGLK